jgi:hypothetical protein
VGILDRIEHRQAHLGLRFSGPPLWLEVTMTGPDSDLWPASAEEGQEWNWQSSAPCTDAGLLTDGGADDDRLLAAAARYTIENLILNAVHEIGEWLRFDGQRLFPAHLSRSQPLSRPDVQGNGEVQVQIFLESEAGFPPVASDRGGVSQTMALSLLGHVTETAPATRFTYLPDTTISFAAAGPVIGSRPGGGASSVWRSTWSAATLEASESSAEELHILVVQDVHRAVVLFEADRICRAFHVDGQRPWRLADPAPGLGAEPPDANAQRALLAVSVCYSTVSSPAGPPMPSKAAGRPIKGDRT